MKRVLYALAVLLGLGACGVVCQRVAARGRFVAPYSTYGAGPTGTRGLFELLSESGVVTRRWSEDLGALPAGGMLVALGGCEARLARPLSRYEQEELDRWIGAGGTLLVAGARDYLPHGFGVGFEHEEPCTEESESTEATAEEDDIVWTTPLAGPLSELDLIPLKSPGVLQLDEYANHQPLLGVGEDVHATVLPRGRGHVIWFASASPFQNSELRDSEGGVIFMRLLAQFAPHGAVSFDEYHLGVGEKRSLMAYLRGTGVLPVVLQVLVAVLLLLWRAGARFGGVRRELESVPLGTASYVGSMASLLERANDPRGIAQILLRQGLRWVAKKHRIVVEHDHAEAVRLAAELRATGQSQAALQVERMTHAAQIVDAHTKTHQLRHAAQEIDDAARVAIQLIDPLKPIK